MLATAARIPDPPGTRPSQASAMGAFRKRRKPALGVEVTPRGWVAVQELKVSYHNFKTILFPICP